MDDYEGVTKQEIWFTDGEGVRMVGRKEVGVKRGDEMRELISVVECERHGLRRPFTMRRLKSRGMDEGLGEQGMVSGSVKGW